MLDWLKKQLGNDTAHPLGTDSGIEAFLESLPESQAIAALDSVAEVFGSAAELKLPLRRLRRALRILDKAVQPRRGELWHTLLRDSQGEQIAEANWQSLMRWYREAHLGYGYCLKGLPPRAEWDDEDREYAPLLASRAMHALVQQKTLSRLRYRAPGGEFWSQAHALYARAESLGVLRDVIEMYSGSGARTSVSREYAVGLIFAICPLGNLVPAQLLALKLILHQFGHLITVLDEPDDRAEFVIDTRRNTPPERWLPGLARREGMRWFGLGGSRPYLATLAGNALDRKSMPDWATPSGCNEVNYHRLILKLARHLSAKPPERRHRRNRSQGEVLAALGFTQARRMVAYSEFARSGAHLAIGNYTTSVVRDQETFNRLRFDSVQMVPARPVTPVSADAPPEKRAPMEMLKQLETEGDRQMMRRWSLLDLSDSGFGVLTGGSGPSVLLGALCAWRDPEDPNWKLAIVRRLDRDRDGKPTAGLERLGGESVCAKVRPLEDSEISGWDALPGSGIGFQDALLVRGAPEQLLVPKGSWKDGRVMLLSVGKERRPVALGELVEDGPDYDLITLHPSPAAP